MKNILICVSILLSFSSYAEYKILFIGDSLTAGYGIEKDKSFPAIIEKELKESDVKVKVTNAGISGSTSASALSRVKWFLKDKPNLLVLILGGNDGLRGLETSKMKANLSQAIELAQQNNIDIILGGMRVPSNYGEDYQKKFQKVYPELAKKFGVDLVPFILKGVGGKKDLNLPDRIHPNEKGHQAIAELLKPYILKFVK